MRGIGRGVREFNDAKENVKNEIDLGMREKDKTPAPEQREVIKETELPK
jgi:sec-independent protein translocase protein TatA